MTEEVQKEFLLDKGAAAEFLKDIAESLEEDEEVAIEGGDWKAYQEEVGKVPMRVFADENGIEIGFKIESE